jgi:excisionase family DNA binding protein
MSPTEGSALLTVREVAEYLRVSRATVRRWVEEGWLPAPLRFGPRCRRWSWEQISSVTLSPGTSQTRGHSLKAALAQRINKE